MYPTDNTGDNIVKTTIACKEIRKLPPAVSVTSPKDNTESFMYSMDNNRDNRIVATPRKRGSVQTPSAYLTKLLTENTGDQGRESSRNY